MKTIKERFDEKWMPEPFSGCWLWTAACDRKGYGKIGDGRKTKIAHRISFQFHRGLIPDGVSVLHRCDTPSCVNPDHLFLGTQAENIADMCFKGRRVGNIKLTPEAVIEIRNSPDSQSVVARRFGITKSNVSMIKTGRNWKMFGGG